MIDRRALFQLLTAAPLGGILAAAPALPGALGATPAAGGVPSARQGRGPLKNWLWLRGDFDDLEAWRVRFDQWRAAGFHAVLPNVGDPAVLRRMAPVAQAAGLELHAWIFTMMRGGMETEHPEWYAVNRRGRSTAEAPPYVDYYRFLCPNRQPVRQHIADHVARLGEVEGLTGVHLDYVRFPDVILPRALWSTYGLVQDRELPEFDYCYCDVCRREYRRQSGVDPLDPLAMPDPPSSESWVRFRHRSISRVVHEVAAVARAAGKMITAAVFPTPAIARALVRQDWVDWGLDALLPMTYHAFYEETVDWIEPATRAGVEALAGSAPLYSGLYVPDLDPEGLAEAARRALAGGASGIALFHGLQPTSAHWDRLAAVLRNQRAGS